MAGWFFAGLGLAWSRGVAGRGQRAGGDGDQVADVADVAALAVLSARLPAEVEPGVAQQIIKHGGRIMGVVLNRRRFFIPEFIYTRL